MIGVFALGLRVLLRFGGVQLGLIKVLVSVSVSSLGMRIQCLEFGFLEFPRKFINLSGMPVSVSSLGLRIQCLEFGFLEFRPGTCVFITPRRRYYAYIYIYMQMCMFLYMYVFLFLFIGFFHLLIHQFMHFCSYSCIDL